MNRFASGSRGRLSSRRSVVAWAVACAAVWGGQVASLPAQGTPQTSEGYLPPLVSVAQTDRPPSIDGMASPGEWEGTAAVSGFLHTETMTLAARQTTVRITYDDTALYFLYQSPVPPGVSLLGAVEQRDGPVWNDDAIELFLNVPGTGVEPATLYQFVGNSVGGIFDRRQGAGEGFGTQWQGAWTYANQVRDGGWTAELSIPFTDLGVGRPADGEMWRVNFARDWQTPQEWTSWPLSTTFSEVARMGYL